jgi:hypothetical protein
MANVGQTPCLCERWQSQREVRERQALNNPKLPHLAKPMLRGLLSLYLFLLGLLLCVLLSFPPDSKRRVPQVRNGPLYISPGF